MATAAAIRHGNFDGLASDYAKHRPGYSEAVVSSLLSLVGKSPGDVDFADIGAGTGIWTRLMARRGCRAVAVEPSDPMRAEGLAGNEGLGILWLKGSAEDTGLPSAGFDVCSMASSFHWADFDVATDEFARILRPGGLFIALWNPRNIEANPLLVGIEDELRRLVPELKRVSSGRSEFCETLTERFRGRTGFENLLYLEGHHVEHMTPDRYLGAWRSVNDIRVQAGEERFAQFMEYVEAQVKTLDVIEAPYTTRAWIVRRV